MKRMLYARRGMFSFRRGPSGESEEERGHTQVR